MQNPESKNTNNQNGANASSSSSNNQSSTGSGLTGFLEWGYQTIYAFWPGTRATTMQHYDNTDNAAAGYDGAVLIDAQGERTQDVGNDFLRPPVLTGEGADLAIAAPQLPHTTLQWAFELVSNASSYLIKALIALFPRKTATHNDKKDGSQSDNSNYNDPITEKPSDDQCDNQSNCSGELSDQDFNI